MQGVQTELGTVRAEIGTMRSELSAQVGALRTDVREDIRETREERSRASQRVYEKLDKLAELPGKVETVIARQTEHDGRQRQLITAMDSERGARRVWRFIGAVVLALGAGAIGHLL